MSTALSPLLAPMFSSATMRTACDDATFLQHMLDFEAALARAEAATGVIPRAAASTISGACRAVSFDLAMLAEDLEQTFRRLKQVGFTHVKV